MKPVRYMVLLMTSAALFGCGGGTVRETLGMERTAPDEFRVVTRPPLSVPPQFSLRAPSVGIDPIEHIPTDAKAEALILGKPEPAASENVFSLTPGTADTAVVPVEITPSKFDASSNAESRFLLNAGADNIDPNIRTSLVEEKITLIQQEEDESWWDFLSTNPAKKEPLVDAKKEAERIKTNQSEGKPVTEGETPEVKQRDRGVLGRILGD